MNHPNILQMIAAVQEQRQHYLIVEHVSGGSLAALRNQPKQAARLLGAAVAIPELYIDLWPHERLELD